MATQDIVQQLLGVVAKNPSILTNLMEHPYSTVAEVTGEDREISKQEAAEVVTATTALASGREVDFGQLGGIASQLLGQNNNSVHSLASTLLGAALGGGQQQQQASSGISADILSNLASVAFSGGRAQSRSPIDLSDGFGLDDIIGIAGLFLGRK